MIAGWRRRGLASAQRSKRRTIALVVVLAVLALVVAEVAADVVNADRRAAAVTSSTFVVEVVPVIDESNMLASIMHLVHNGATSLNRKALELTLGRLVTGTADNLDQLGTLGIPAPTARSQQLLEAALASRSSGARLLTGGISVATGPMAASSGAVGTSLDSSTSRARARATSLVVRAGRELIRSDQEYRAFVRSLPRGSGRERLPTSVWVTFPASWSKTAASAWVTRLASAQRLQVRQDLVIVAVSLQPPVVRITGLPTTTTTSTTSTSATTSTTTSTTIPASTSSSTTTSTTTTTIPTIATTTTVQLPPSGSTSVLPPTNRISVLLVVANAGNVSLSRVWASASLVPEPNGEAAKRSPPASSASLRIGRLPPGASVEVTLPPLVVESGSSYVLWASVGTGPLPRHSVTGPPVGVGQTEKVRIRVAMG